LAFEAVPDEAKAGTDLLLSAIGLIVGPDVAVDLDLGMGVELPKVA